MRIYTLIRDTNRKGENCVPEPETPWEFFDRVRCVSELYEKADLELVYTFVPYAAHEEVWLLFN